jgi:hypothetical protein
MAIGDPISATMDGTVSTYSVDITGTVSTSPVPEPGAYAMLGAGTLLLGLRRRVKHASVTARR